MAHDRRVSFGTQQPARWTEEGDGHGLLVVRPQSVFNRLGPKVDMGDPPYVPESVGEAPLPGMIFGCTNETLTECISRQLFGLPIANKPQVMRISPGASLFLFNFRTKQLHGIYEATSHGGVHIVRHAFSGKFGAQVKVRLAEDCPPLDEREFKEAILTNYVDARKFKFSLNEAQVCRLKTLFRTKAADAWAVSEGIIRRVQFHPSQQQNTRNTIQVQRRVNSAFNDEVEGSRTLRISVPPSVSRVHASPSLIRGRSPKGLEVSICSIDNNRYRAPDSPRRQVVMYDARKEQSATPVLRSKVIRSVKEVVQSRPGNGISQDRKRCADRSPQRRLLLQEQGQEIGEDRSGKHCTDLRELLTRPNLKRLKSSTKESAKRLLSIPIGSVDSGGKSTESDDLSKGKLKKDLEQGLTLPSKIHSTISLGPQKALSSKDLVIPKIAGSVQISEKNAETIGTVEGVQGNLKSASVFAGSRIQSLKAPECGCVNLKKPTALGTEGRAVLNSSTSENPCNNMDLKTADRDGVSSCVQLSTSLPVKSGVVQKLNGMVTKSDSGDQSKDGGLDIYVSLNVDDAEIVRQIDSRIESENQHGVEGIVGSILGKRSGESNQLEPALDSPMAVQAPQTEKFVQLLKVGPEDSLLKVSLPVANVSETLQERETGTCIPSAEEYHLTSQIHPRNASLNMENLSEVEKRLDPVHVVPLNVTIPVVSPVIMGNTGDMQPRDCKRQRTEKESGVSSPVSKMHKIGQDDAGCSYVTAGVSIPIEGDDTREKDSQKYGLDCKMPLQTPSNSLLSGKSEDLWNSRTFRYGRPRISDATNYGSRSSKSGSEPISTAGKLEPNVEGMKVGEESVYSGGENFERQPESSNATETSRTSGILGTQHPLLVCELGNPGGLPLDGKTIKVDSMDDSPKKHQATRVAADAQQSILPSEIDSTCRPDRPQSMKTALDPSSNELETIELGKKTVTMKGLTNEESQVPHKVCHPDDFSSKDTTQPATTTGRDHPSLLSCLSHGADAPRDARALAEDGVQHSLNATSRDIPSACTSTASLSGCSGLLGEAELEISIPIEEEELEICLPIEEDEEVDAVPEDQIRRVWGSSTRDITPWKLLQKNPSQDT